MPENFPFGHLYDTYTYIPTLGTLKNFFFILYVVIRAAYCEDYQLYQSCLELSLDDDKQKFTMLDFTQNH